MKKVFALTIAVLTLLNCSASFAMNRNYENAMSFDVLYNSLYSIGNKINWGFRFDLPYANNDNFYYNPPLTIYKQNGKISAIEIETLLWKKGIISKGDYSINIQWILNYSLIYKGVTELIPDDLENIRRYHEEKSSKENPQYLGENYIFYYDEPYNRLVYVYVGK